MVEMVHEGSGFLVCCGQPMQLITENSTDAERDIHIPSVEQFSNWINVKIGKVAHPMEKNHSIEWIEFIADGKTSTKFLKPHERPEALFQPKSKNFTVRGYCNIHGLWKSSEQ